MKPSAKSFFFSSFFSSFFSNTFMLIVSLPDGFSYVVFLLFAPAKASKLMALLLFSLSLSSNAFSKSFNISLVLSSNSAFSFSNLASLSWAAGSNLISLNCLERKSYILSDFSWSLRLSSAVRMSSSDYATGLSSRSLMFPIIPMPEPMAAVVPLPNVLLAALFIEGLSSISKSNSPWGLWTTSRRFWFVTISGFAVEAGTAVPASKSNCRPPWAGLSPGVALL